MVTMSTSDILLRHFRKMLLYTSVYELHTLIYYILLLLPIPPPFHTQSQQLALPDGVGLGQSMAKGEGCSTTHAVCHPQSRCTESNIASIQKEVQGRRDKRGAIIIGTGIHLYTILASTGQDKGEHNYVTTMQ